ncbi:MAG TPA: PEP-CTERM sorting domain-containing protein [Phycisphaerae bacterium]|nr:PEP-CTERM sorting domain-containing protein [Phycisphaerae bacterium]
MKRLVLSLVAAALLTGPAMADTITQWTFEVSVPTHAGPHAAEIGSGEALGFHSDPNTVYSNPVGNGSLESFSSNTWNAGDYYQFKTSTLGYENITFQFDQTRSSTGPGVFDVEWSTDGTTWANLVDDYAVTVVTWSSLTYNPASTFGPYAAPAALDDQPVVYFRLIAQVAGSAPAGTNRVDDVIVGGSVIPEPASLILLTLGGLGLLRRR